ncbi:MULTISPECIES: gamma-glutamyl-gamma-aminobutyrate hydrolase family protein [Ehrlichia]|uniref:Peptidase C26 family protein n=1 Tax=Ehrlichia cf. muris str. EmCRT TaxID=1359167 RepID=A0A0F3NE05_9RICK|nr:MULTISPECIES: gamma-glutamyl-gamma-aminobutyrate hydrolase family protein [Ehrlichia]KJV65947.1 peptidase C26 family protein [Ehrlichia cf. muris str. EmCRT]OUC04818.1 glutamine amidotransferase [Ehrlichia sp. Wisconsin_h]
MRYFILILSFLLSISAVALETVQNKMVVGFVRTEKETYPEEWTFSNNIAEMLEKLGAEVVLLDYNAILDFKKIKNESLEEAKNDMSLLEQIEANKIQDAVHNFIKQHKINRIFIPGNYYNVDTEPYSPTPNRQLVTNAIVKIVESNPNIHLIGVCGGLQGIMHAVGVEVIRVKKIIASKEAIAAHSISMPDPHRKDVGLHRLRVVPGSRLSSIISKYTKPDDNGWISIYFPDAHGGVVNNSQENIQKIESLGYKIVGFSDDGIIEAIEDKHGNILFQDHPEALAINAIKGSEQDIKDDNDIRRRQATLSAIAIINDFLYRH